LRIGVLSNCRSKYFTDTIDIKCNMTYRDFPMTSNSVSFSTWFTNRDCAIKFNVHIYKGLRYQVTIRNHKSISALHLRIGVLSNCRSKYFTDTIDIKCNMTYRDFPMTSNSVSFSTFSVVLNIAEKLLD
jgi:DNA polymerase II large subunit